MKAFGPLTGLVLAAFLAGCGSTETKEKKDANVKGNPPAASSKENDAKTPDKKLGTPAVAAQALAKAFADDAAAAKKKYEDDVIIAGKVIDKSDDGLHHLTLEGYKKEGAQAVNVKTSFRPEAQEQAKATKVGDTVKIKGDVVSYLSGNVDIVGATFVK